MCRQLLIFLAITLVTFPYLALTEDDGSEGRKEGLLDTVEAVGDIISLTAELKREESKVKEIKAKIKELRAGRAHLGMSSSSLVHMIVHDDKQSSGAEPSAGEACAPQHSAEPCHHIRTNPACEFERVDYLGFHYCTIKTDLGLPGVFTLIALVPWIILLFVFICLAADGFFAPAVAMLADYLGLRADVAGATLLAFGNGAPDFFTQVAAITASDRVDIPLALGESVGSGFCTCSLGLALMVLQAPYGSFAVDPLPFPPNELRSYLPSLAPEAVAAEAEAAASHPLNIKLANTDESSSQTKDHEDPIDSYEWLQ
ncbi:hypothetical protein CYMTET_9073, partial [Cymbomonas tetramitiformis]